MPIVDEGKCSAEAALKACWRERIKSALGESIGWDCELEVFCWGLMFELEGHKGGCAYLGSMINLEGCLAGGVEVPSIS